MVYFVQTVGELNPIMQRALKRTANRCLRHWIFVLRAVLILLIIGLAIVGWFQFFDLKTLGKKPKYKVENAFDTQEVTLESQLYNITVNSTTAATLSESDYVDVNDLGSLKRMVELLNDKQTIHNLDEYGPLRNDSLVVVIQVHTRVNYLRETVKSLSQARGIDDVLLIFSHDYYDVQINELVRSIAFCKTMQIFFPHSIQLNPDEFPGQSANDCPQKITRNEAIKMNCTNAMTPDRNGVYRSAQTTQLKHHWWWKMNTAFDGLAAVKYYTGLMLFIEEDHYVVEDFIPVLKLIQRTCPQSKIFSLGEHSENVYSRKPQIHVSNWISNLGMSFNRTVWNELVQCANKFCYYDDYNWDWSLQKMTKICAGHKFWTSTLQDSRIHHIGQCGMHFKNNCTDMSHVVRLVEKLRVLKLYPEEVDVTVMLPRQEPGNGFGGWGDPRDQKLCMDMVIHPNA